VKGNGPSHEIVGSTVVVMFSINRSPRLTLGSDRLSAPTWFAVGKARTIVTRLL